MSTFPRGKADLIAPKVRVYPKWTLPIPTRPINVIASNGIVSSSPPYTPLAIMTASPIASVRVFETVRDADLATFGALPTSSMIDRAIIMLNDHRFWGHASDPSSSSGKTLSSFHPLLARPCRSALPRERFSPLALFGPDAPGRRCPLIGEEQKFAARCQSDAIDPTRKSA